VRKPPGTTRIVCVGDSMTFGWGVEREDTYPRLLAKALAARYPERSIEVLNLGVPGLTVTQITELTRRDILRFEPDIAIVAFGMNDYRIDRWGKTTMAVIESVRKLDPLWMSRYDWLLGKSDLARYLATRRSRDYAPSEELLAAFGEQTSDYFTFLRSRGIATIAFTEHAPWFPGAAAYADTFRQVARRNDVPCVELGPLLTASRDPSQLLRFESTVNWTSAFEDVGIDRADKARLLPGYNLFVDCGHLSRDGADILVAALLPQVGAALAHRDGTTPPAGRGA
jgi:lysophospholipase L1-like esterase